MVYLIFTTSNNLELIPGILSNRFWLDVPHDMSEHYFGMMEFFISINDKW